MLVLFLVIVISGEQGEEQGREGEQEHDYDHENEAEAEAGGVDGAWVDVDGRARLRQAYGGQPRAAARCEG